MSGFLLMLLLSSPWAPADAVSDARAAAALEKTCLSGDGGSCDGLGKILAEGLGVPQDEARAVQLFQKACDLKDAAGCSNVAQMLVDGRGVSRNPGQGATLFK